MNFAVSSCYSVLSEARCEFIAPVVPEPNGIAGGPINGHWLTTEAIIYRYRAGIPYRDVPPHLSGPWQCVWKCHHRYCLDEAWDQLFAVLQPRADAAAQISWGGSLNSTANRASQYTAKNTSPNRGNPAFKMPVGRAH